MAKSQGTKKIIKKKSNQKQDLEKLKNDSFLDKYQDDEDYDDAFKNLLRPIEMITRTNYTELVHFDLIKELDSYLNHLKISSDGGSSIFVEAAMMIQNVNVIYQKKVDEIVDDTMKLIAKFQAYRTNPNGIIEAADNVEDKKKKKEKKKFYSSFEPIEIEILPSKIFDCKKIDVSKLPPLPKFVLNTNIKVTNKFNRLMPHINVGNGENIGKKYDFKMSGPLNGRLAVNESTSCTSNGHIKRSNYLNYWESADSSTIDFMEFDEDDAVIRPSSPEPAVFDQTIANKLDQSEVTEEVCVANARAQSPANVLNVDEVIITHDAKAWASVITKADNLYTDKPIVKKRISKKKKNKKNGKQSNDGQNNDEQTYIPTFIPREMDIIASVQQASSTSADPAFKKIIHAAQKARRSEIMKMRYKRMMESAEKSEPEESEHKEFKIPVYIGDFDDDLCGNDIEEQEPDPNVQENILTYRKNLEEMKQFEQDEEEMVAEQLEMRKRVQAWHDNLRPILDEEEERGTAFDIHEYGTKILNRFSQIGEQKSFTELFGGMEKEEVARYFLSILMLTNTYNLKVLKPPNGEMIVELLKIERHHEELQANVGKQVNNE